MVLCIPLSAALSSWRRWASPRTGGPPGIPQSGPELTATFTHPLTSLPAAFRTLTHADSKSTGRGNVRGIGGPVPQFHLPGAWGSGAGLALFCVTLQVGRGWLQMRGTQRLACPYPSFWRASQATSPTLQAPAHPRDQGAEPAHPRNPESIPGLCWEIWGFLPDNAHGSLRGWDTVWRLAASQTSRNPGP